jgi:hypothetical protein
VTGLACHEALIGAVPQTVKTCDAAHRPCALAGGGSQDSCSHLESRVGGYAPSRSSHPFELCSWPPGHTAASLKKRQHFGEQGMNVCQVSVDQTPATVLRMERHQWIELKLHRFACV